MKHIISLALKYIRRQKMRTVLTFLCITLSVFIFSAFGAYMGSVLQTCKNTIIKEVGSYEADIGNWFENIDDSEQAIDIIKNHIVVDDYYVSLFESLCGNVNRLENDGEITYFEFTDGTNTKNISYIMESVYNGNPELLGRTEQVYGVDNSRNGITLPDWFKNFGYHVGDTVTFRLRKVTAEIDEDSETVKNTRAKLLDKYGSSLVNDDSAYQELSRQEQKKLYQGSLYSALSDENNLDESAMKNVKYGEYFEYTIEIGGFTKYYNSDNLNFFVMGQDRLFLSDFMEENESMIAYSGAGAKIRITDNIDFEEAMIMLCDDLGFSDGYYYSDLPELNSTLLLLELKSTGALVDSIPMIIMFLVLIFLVWLVSRFIIDNAFEISNQERSSQFALLRVIGASRTQIKALVFTEALFYTITSVPLGTVIAYLLCSSSVSSLRKMGFDTFEFKANGYFVAGGIIMCILAIFISSYTSALWASRKSSLTEAINYGKPKSPKIHRRKSKLRLSSAQFLRRYTNKNIMRTKGRYIISTITMTFGVMFFTFSMMLGIYFFAELKGILENARGYDFYISCELFDDLEKAEQAFNNDELFSDVMISQNTSLQLDADGTDVQALKQLAPYDVENINYVAFWAVDERYFNENLSELTGMTYDEFMKSGKAICNISSYGTEDIARDEYGNRIAKYNKSYEPLETPIKVKYSLYATEIEVMGSMCADSIDYALFTFILPIDSDISYDLSYGFNIWAKVNGTEHFAEAERVLNDFLNTSCVFDYTNEYAMHTGLNEFVKAIIKIVATFIISIWLVGILSMTNSINTSVLNRCRELMMMRCIGMSRKQLRQTIILESVMFSAVSSSIGTILAIAVFFIVITAIGLQPVMLVSMAVGLIISIAVNILIAGLASIPGIKNLERAESLVDKI